MIYCRFSDKNEWSDVDCYKAQDGFKIRVRSRRPVIPPFPILQFSWARGHLGARLWIMANKLHYWTISKIPFRPIGGELDGKTFTYGCAKGCAEGLEDCRYKGYRVPQYAIDALIQEANEQQTAH